MLHGAKDAIIPLRHGEVLFAAAHQPKTMVVYPEAHHDDYSGEQILTPLVERARNAGLSEDRFPQVLLHLALIEQKPGASIRRKCGMRVTQRFYLRAES